MNHTTFDYSPIACWSVLSCTLNIPVDGPYFLKGLKSPRSFPTQKWKPPLHPYVTRGYWPPGFSTLKSTKPNRWWLTLPASTLASCCSPRWMPRPSSSSRPSSVVQEVGMGGEEVEGQTFFFFFFLGCYFYVTITVIFFWVLVGSWFWTCFGFTSTVLDVIWNDLFMIRYFFKLWTYYKATRPWFGFRSFGNFVFFVCQIPECQDDGFIPVGSLWSVFWRRFPLKSWLRKPTAELLGMRSIF